MSSLDVELCAPPRPRRTSDRSRIQDLAALVSPRIAAMCRAVAEQGLDDSDAWKVARTYATSDEDARAFWERTVKNPAAANLLRRMRRNESLRLALTPGAIIDDALTLFDDAEDERVRLACLKVIADLMPKQSAVADSPPRPGGSDPASVASEIMASYFGRSVDLPEPRKTIQGELV